MPWLLQFVETATIREIYEQYPVCLVTAIYERGYCAQGWIKPLLPTNTDSMSTPGDNIFLAIHPLSLSIFLKLAIQRRYIVLATSKVIKSHIAAYNLLTSNWYSRDSDYRSES